MWLCPVLRAMIWAGSFADIFKACNIVPVPPVLFLPLPFYCQYPYSLSSIFCRPFHPILRGPISRIKNIALKSKYLMLYNFKCQLISLSSLPLPHLPNLAAWQLLLSLPTYFSVFLFPKPQGVSSCLSPALLSPTYAKFSAIAIMAIPQSSFLWAEYLWKTFQKRESRPKHVVNPRVRGLQPQPHPAYHCAGKSRHGKEQAVIWYLHAQERTSTCPKPLVLSASYPHATTEIDWMSSFQGPAREGEKALRKGEKLQEKERKNLIASFPPLPCNCPGAVQVRYLHLKGAAFSGPQTKALQDILALFPGPSGTWYLCMLIV